MLKMKHLSVILLSWKRPDNIPAILNNLFAIKRINEIILWNNNPELRLTYKHPKLTIFNSPKNYGTLTRYPISLMAKNDTVMFLDDDLYLSEPQIEKLFSEYIKDTSRIYGPYGRKLINYKYNMRNRWGQVDIIIGRCMLFDKALLSNFFKYLSPWKKLLHEDDILFSLSQGKKHYAINLGHIKQLPANDALYKKPAHLIKRQKMVNYCLNVVPELKKSLTTSKLDNLLSYFI